METAGTSASLWKDDEMAQNQRIPAVMLKLKLTFQPNRIGSESVCKCRRKGFSLCASNALWVIR